MSRSRRLSLSLALVVAVLVPLAACGSTRFVVVQQPAAGAAAAPTTVAAEAADAADESEIRAAVDGALGLDQRPFEERTQYLTSDAEDLGGTYAAVLELVSTLDAEVRVDSVAVTADGGTATVTVVVDGADYAAGIPVALVDDDGTWKVTRAGACAALAIGSPCPET